MPAPDRCSQLCHIMVPKVKYTTLKLLFLIFSCFVPCWPFLLWLLLLFSYVPNIQLRGYGNNDTWWTMSENANLWQIFSLTNQNLKCFEDFCCGTQEGWGSPFLFCGCGLRFWGLTFFPCWLWKLFCIFHFFIFFGIDVLQYKYPEACTCVCVCARRCLRECNKYNIFLAKLWSMFISKLFYYALNAICKYMALNYIFAG